MKWILFISVLTLVFTAPLPAQDEPPALEPSLTTEPSPASPEAREPDEEENGHSGGHRAHALRPSPRNQYEVPAEGHLEWKPLLWQNGLFLAAQHSFRFATQEETRGNLRGPFFRDYFRSINGFQGWDDGDSWLANFVGHPMQGAVYGYTYLQNHTREKYLPVDFKSGDYWRSRMKAMAWMAVASTHYEIGPLGEAAFGNTGKREGTKGAVDLVITPTMGAGLMIIEDFLDDRIVIPLERRLQNRYLRLFIRSALNPDRAMANLLRFKVPWHRDTRAGVGFQSDAFPRGGRP
jgi:hypothetical protein